MNFHLFSLISLVEGIATPLRASQRGVGGVPRVGGTHGDASVWCPSGRGYPLRHGWMGSLVSVLPMSARRSGYLFLWQHVGELLELFPDLKAGTGLGGKVVVAIELRLWKTIVEQGQQLCYRAALLRGHRVGWDKLCRE